MIYYLALENLPQRYTVMMNEALAKYVDEVITPYEDNEVIEVGEFLDVNRTIRFKNLQMAMVAEKFERKQINDGDIFLVGDVFYPGIEALRYMSELQGIRIKIFAFNFAGRADKNDFVQKLGKWSDISEQGYHLCCDGIFVGSEYHRQNLLSHFHKCPPIVVTGLVWDLRHVYSYLGINYDGKHRPHFSKEDYIIFPHRLCKEKGIDEFRDFARKTKKQIIVTSSGKAQTPTYEFLKADNVVYLHSLTKEAYYGVFARARWYISTAYQETFGYTLQEAIAFGCEILVPKRACYSEMVPEENLYTYHEQIDKLFMSDKRTHFSYTQRWDDNAKRIVNICRQAV